MKGILERLREEGNTTVYDPKALTYERFKKLLQDSLVSWVPGPAMTTLFTSAYGNALLKNDKKEIAYWEKRHRIDAFHYLRLLLSLFGSKKARVIAWLNNGTGSVHQDHWTINSYTSRKFKGNWRYKDIYDGELDTVLLQVSLKNDKFDITLLADDSDGYGGYKYKKVLAQNVSFDSIINHIKYITKKLENGTL